MSVQIEYSRTPVLVPMEGCCWADTMVLNPAIVKDPQSSRLHMLFRATGPYPHKRIKGKPLPYPIFLGYACSDDNGVTWQADFSRPALSPALEYTPDRIYVDNVNGHQMVNYANGCIEDPRLFWLEGELYLTVACRMFPPGPYWEHDDPMQCAPEWTQTVDNPFGRAAQENLTVSVLYKVLFEHLVAQDYDNAFAYITHLNDPEISDNRDVFLFPEKMCINGKEQYVCVHRPKQPGKYHSEMDGKAPSMFLSAAETIFDFPTSKATHKLLAEPIFEWEANRIGGSWAPIKISNDEWLLSYHGKQDDRIGYTQSFMILRQPTDSFPEVVHRCSERLIYARQEWELSGQFAIPCIFTCSGVVVGDELIMGYGAADQKIGIAKCCLGELISYVRKFDVTGNMI
ncbi:MAG: hypothetical protein PHF37_05290 [Phycisphaerae bacterium]|nr:hypothetical protein [Phycisphaerae bacterium]